MSNDSKQVIATETAYLRKWPSPAERDQAQLPHEIIVISQTSRLEDGAIQADDPVVEVATDAARIAALNPLAAAAEKRARHADEGAE